MFRKKHGVCRQKVRAGGGQELLLYYPLTSSHPSASLLSLQTTIIPVNGIFFCMLHRYIRKPGNVSYTHNKPTILVYKVLLIPYKGDHFCSLDDTKAQRLVTWSWLWGARPFVDTSDVIILTSKTSQDKWTHSTIFQQGCTPALGKHGDPIPSSGFHLFLFFWRLHPNH